MQNLLWVLFHEFSPKFLVLLTVIILPWAAIYVFSRNFYDRRIG
jgi:hypothetical protein